mgnify:CR=1 FL=1
MILQARVNIEFVKLFADEIRNLNKVVEKLGVNYRYFKKNTWKANQLLTKESLPFEFIFKQTITENKCSISYDKENVIIIINDNTFSFSKMFFFLLVCV